jgi:hypothetical protein
MKIHEVSVQPPRVDRTTRPHLSSGSSSGAGRPSMPRKLWSRHVRNAPKTTAGAQDVSRRDRPKAVTRPIRFIYNRRSV